IGYPEYADEGLYNAFALLHDERIAAKYRKQLLPNYGVFDDKRHFANGMESVVAEVKGIPLGLTICEDRGSPGAPRRTREAAAKLILNIPAPAFKVGCEAHRETQVLAARVRECGLPIVYRDRVGVKDELVFDGISLAINDDGKVALRAPD